MHAFRTMNNDRRRMSAAIMVLGAALLLFIAPPVIKKLTDPVPPAGAVPASGLGHICHDVPGAFQARWLANEAPAGSNHMGPAITEESAMAAWNAIHAGHCVDPALAVPHSEQFLDRPLDEATRQSRIYELAANPDQWKFTVKVMEDLVSTAKLEIIDPGDVTYWTLYAVPQPDGAAPLIQQSQEHMSGQKVLKVTLADGRVLMFKLNCGGQPVSIVEFPGVPHRGSPPPEIPPPGETVPPTTPTTVPIPTCPNGQPIPPSGLCPKPGAPVPGPGGPDSGQPPDQQFTPPDPQEQHDWNDCQETGYCNGSQPQTPISFPPTLPPPPEVTTPSTTPLTDDPPSTGVVTGP